MFEPDICNLRYVGRIGLFSRQNRNQVPNWLISLIEYTLGGIIRPKKESIPIFPKKFETSSFSKYFTMPIMTKYILIKVETKSPEPEYFNTT